MVELVGRDDELGVGVTADAVDGAGNASANRVGVATGMLDDDGDWTIGAAHDGCMKRETVGHTYESLTRTAGIIGSNILSNCYLRPGAANVLEKGTPLAYKRGRYTDTPAVQITKLERLLLPEINTRVVQSFVTSLALGELLRKTIENIFLTLSSLLRTAKAWEYADGRISHSNLTTTRRGKEEKRCFKAQEVGRIISAASLSLASLTRALSASPIEALRQLYCLSRATSWQL